MALWAREALRGLDLGDARREARLLKVVSDLAARAGQSVPSACGDWAATKACYRLFDSDEWTREALFAAAGAGTAERRGRAVGPGRPAGGDPSGDGWRSA